MESPEGHSDEQIIKQQREIEREICDTIPLVSELQAISTLSNEYTDDQVYCAKVRDLGAKYAALRRTRPDGNCFFRAFAYAYLEHLVRNKPEYEEFRELAHKSKDHLVSLGFPDFTLDDFHATFMEVIDRVRPTDDPAQDLAVLHDTINEQGYSDYVVVYLRLITSGHLQEGADFYQNFIDGHCTMNEFCKLEVEPMYKESDHIHIIALCTALNVGVRVEYMDRGEGEKVRAHDFPEDLRPIVFLLYRPGHYDVLYPGDDEPTEHSP